MTCTKERVASQRLFHSIQREQRRYKNVKTKKKKKNTNILILHSKIFLRLLDKINTSLIGIIPRNI